MTVLCVLTEILSASVSGTWRTHTISLSRSFVKRKVNMKKKTITTPFGIAKYPWLNTPKTTFKEEGEYVVSLIVPEAEAQSLVEVISEMVDAAYNEKYNELKEKDRKKLRKYFPFCPEETDEGNTTGNIEFKCRTDATYKDKKGNLRERAPDLFDRKGAPLDREKDLIFGGSRIRVNITPVPFYMPNTGQVGITLYLNGVQVDVFAQRDSAATYGFTPVEDGEDEDSEGDANGAAEDF